MKDLVWRCTDEEPLEQPHPFAKVFRPRTPPEAIDLISKLLEYTPSARLTAIEGASADQ